MLLGVSQLVTGPIGPAGPSGSDASPFTSGLFTLAGAVIAGLIGLIVALYVERQRDKRPNAERREDRLGVARALWADLTKVHNQLDLAIKTRFVSKHDRAPLANWESSGHRLAPALSFEEFATLVTAFSRVSDYWAYQDNFLDKLDDQGARTLHSLDVDIARGLNLLFPLAFPDAGPDDPAWGTEHIPGPDEPDSPPT